MVRLKWISALLLTAFPLASCDRPDNGKIAEAERVAAEEAGNDGKIDCALAGRPQFSRSCETEMLSDPDGAILTIRHADGGFRRFVLLTDGRGLAAADGFDDTRIAVLSDGMIEVTAGQDRYRLPASIKPGGSRTADAASQAPVNQP